MKLTPPSEGGVHFHKDFLNKVTSTEKIVTNHSKKRNYDIISYIFFV